MPPYVATRCRGGWARLRSASSQPLLAFEEVASSAAAPQEGRLAFVLHGLLGQARNWRSFAQAVAKEAAERGSHVRLLLVDLRHHGCSPPQPGEDSLAAAAADLERLASVVGQPQLVIGHSLGGKVALQYAQSGRVRGEVWALDSSPGSVTVGGDPHGTEKVLACVASLPPTFASRTECSAQLAAAALPPAITSWLLSSLVPANGEQGRLRFAFALDGARRLFDSYKSTCLWHVVEQPPPGVDVHLVRAGESRSWEGEAGTRFEALKATGRTHVVPGAGHWLHVSHAAEVRRLLLPAVLGR